MNEQIADACRPLAGRGAAAIAQGTMVAADFHRIADAGAAEPCDALFREFIDWMAGQLRALHGFAVPALEVEGIHRQFRAQWPRLFVDPGRMVLATVDGQPVGVGVLKPVAADEVEVKRLYVRPQMRGRHLGRRLLDLLVAEAGALGFRRMRLETFAFMTEAVAMYRSAGFVEVPQFAAFEGASHGWAAAEIFMTLELCTDRDRGPAAQSLARMVLRTRG